MTAQLYDQIPNEHLTVRFSWDSGDPGEVDGRALAVEAACCDVVDSTGASKAARDYAQTPFDQSSLTELDSPASDCGMKNRRNGHADRGDGAGALNILYNKHGMA